MHDLGAQGRQGRGRGGRRQAAAAGFNLHAHSQGAQPQLVVHARRIGVRQQGQRALGIALSPGQLGAGQAQARTFARALDGRGLGHLGQ